MARATRITLACLGIVLAAGQPAHSQDEAANGMHPRVKMETTLGDLVLELNAEKAPITTLNFIQYAEDKFYDETVFHRVIPTFMIQGGGFTPDLDKKEEGLREGIKNEWKNGLMNERGTIAMARLGGQPDSATSQFFINVVDNARLDQPQRDGAAYAVFGKVVEGMDVVDKIRNVETKADPKYPGGKVVPAEPVVIKSVRLVRPFDRTKAEALVNAKKVDAKAQKEAKKSRGLRASHALYEEAKAKGNKTDSGVVLYDINEGTGESPQPNDTVELHYTGWLTDGTKFDSSHDRGRPLTLGLGQFVPGFSEGVGSMKVGGTRVIIIPPELGYGERGSPPKIPPNATIVFKVDLLKIK